MTGVELERRARNVLPPVGATGLRMTTVAEPGGRLTNGSPSGLGGSVRFGPVWLVDGGRHESRPIEVFDRQVDALRFFHLIAGTEPAPRSAPGGSVESMGALDGTSDQERTGAPSRVDASPLEPAVARGPEPVAVIPEPAEAGSCAGCGEPLPPGRHGQRRLTCSAACRQRVSYRRAAKAARADADSGTATSHLPRSSDAADAHPAAAPDGLRAGDQLGLGFPGA